MLSLLPPASNGHNPCTCAPVSDLKMTMSGANTIFLTSSPGRGVFSAWLKSGVFEQVILADAGHPQWPGDLDLCPDALYMKLTGKSPEEVFPTLHKLPAHA